MGMPLPSLDKHSKVWRQVDIWVLTIALTTALFVLPSCNDEKVAAQVEDKIKSAEAYGENLIKRGCLTPGDKAAFDGLVELVDKAASDGKIPNYLRTQLAIASNTMHDLQGEINKLPNCE